VRAAADRPVRAALFAGLDVDVEYDAPLAGRTWYKVGGSADALAVPRSEGALSELLGRCARDGVRVRVLGSGANLLVGDEGVDGVVVILEAPCWREMHLTPAGATTLVRVGGGRDLGKTIRETVGHGLSGLEALIGIPAQVGGAVRMNAGGKFGAIGDVVRSVRLLAQDGSARTYGAAEIDFGYRRSDLPAGIVSWAELALTPADPAALRLRSKEISNYKASVQPLAANSAGCMYRNPVDPATGQRVSAGLLIDRAGLKGTRVGGAVVSEQHGNFICAEPGCRAQDIVELSALVADEAFRRTGIRLEREVVFWRRGED
jgi:UDP-N-acetylmuramate dehydrogenase